MSEEFMIYQGRSVPKKTFRAFVYGVDGSQKLAETWIHYEALLATGLWFSKIEEVPIKVTSENEVTLETSINKACDDVTDVTLNKSIDSLIKACEPSPATPKETKTKLGKQGGE